MSYSKDFEEMLKRLQGRSAWDDFEERFREKMNGINLDSAQGKPVDKTTEKAKKIFALYNGASTEGEKESAILNALQTSQN